MSTALIDLLTDSQEAIAKDAALALINLTADPSIAKNLLKNNQVRRNFYREGFEQSYIDPEDIDIPTSSEIFRIGLRRVTLTSTR